MLFSQAKSPLRSALVAIRDVIEIIINKIFYLLQFIQNTIHKYHLHLW